MISSRVFNYSNDFEAVQKFIAEAFLSEEDYEFVFSTRLENVFLEKIILHL